MVENDGIVVAHFARGGKRFIDEDKAIENGDIENICRGFQPLEILFELIPTICIVGNKYTAGLNG